MHEKIGKILFLKVGRVSENKKLNSDKNFSSAIKKYPMDKAYLGQIGFFDDEQADTIHHGGMTKAVLFFSSETYNKINRLAKTDFKYDQIAYYGENLLVEGISEENICIGDILKIGETEVEISQPRQPCWKLSANTKIKDMTSIIYNNGLTGWYARVSEYGEISKGNDIFLVKRAYPKLTISALNKLIVNPLSDMELTKEAIECEALGEAFKESLKGRSKLKNPLNEPFLYHKEEN